MLKNVAVWGVLGGLVLTAASGCAHFHKKGAQSSAAVSGTASDGAGTGKVFLETTAYRPTTSFGYWSAPSAAALVWPKVSAPESPSSAPEPPTSAPASSALPSGYPVPVDICHVISDFGARGRRQHKGVDIKAPGGTPVSATAPGTVKFAGTMRRYGKIVILGHADGYETRYAHLVSYSVQVGDTVEAGEVIGAVGRTGNASTTHVHYEVRRDGLYIDPDPFLETAAM